MCATEGGLTETPHCLLLLAQESYMTPTCMVMPVYIAPLRVNCSSRFREISISCNPCDILQYDYIV
jgi:hypothetical protein